ncbi:MAG: zinc ribbon domain-containing protein [Polyangiaceae bacterium]|nr:zinc ribbon domain-containing protein [Polyangiaceae bacterium]
MSQQGPFPGTAPGGGGTKPCRACGTPLPLAALFCEWCNAPQAGAPKCPHCRTATGVSPHEELRYTCNVCGAPRIPLEAQGVSLSGAEVAPLRQANELRSGRSLWRIGGAVGALGAATAWAFVGLWAIVFGWSTLFAVLAAVFSVPLVALALAAVGKVRAKTRQIGAAIDGAWRAAASDVVRQLHGPVSAKQLAQLLPIGEDQAERLLTELSVDALVSTEVTADGALAYSASGAALLPAELAAPPRMRIEPALAAGAPTPAVPPSAVPASTPVKKHLKATMVGGELPNAARAAAKAAAAKAAAAEAIAAAEAAAAEAAAAEAAEAENPAAPAHERARER